jgi:hypothetical protein
MEQVPGVTTRRSMSERLRAFAEQEASALFDTELARHHEDWRGALVSVKAAVAALETQCDTAISAAPQAPTAAVSALIQKIVAAAAAEAESLVQQVEAGARAEVAEAQALVTQLQADVRAGEGQLALAREQLQVEQTARARAESAAADVRADAGRLQAEVRAGAERLTQAREQLDAEQAARARAESAVKETQVAGEQARSALEVQVRRQESELQSARGAIAALEGRLAAAQAEAANAHARLEALQQAVHGAMSTLTVAGPTAARPGRALPPADHGHKERTRAPIAEPKRPSAAAPSSNAQPNHPAIADAPRAELPPNRYATALLKSIEAMYGQDVESAVPPADIIKRLTDNLRYADQLFAERLRSNPSGDKSALKDHIARLVRTNSGTSFGRDLALAAGDAERHEQREASTAPGGAPVVPAARRRA